MRASFPVRLGLVMLYFILCNYLFLMPGTALPKEDWLDRIYADKWVHIGLFAGLAILGAWAFGNAVRSRPLTAVIVLALYGLAVEFIQAAWVPYRSFDLFDALADLVGAILGMWMTRGLKFLHR
ncbi:MAG: VanZ family protein [Chitinophagaceae bacterium]|nr:MAG: VanZ family protein [Chitinophagaceae bacterium]